MSAPSPSDSSKPDPDRTKTTGSGLLAYVVDSHVLAGNEPIDLVPYSKEGSTDGRSLPNAGWPVDSTIKYTHADGGANIEVKILQRFGKPFNFEAYNVEIRFTGTTSQSFLTQSQAFAAKQDRLQNATELRNGGDYLIDPANF
jgi:hypothetical protein